MEEPDREEKYRGGRVTERQRDKMKEEESEKEERNSSTTIRTAISGQNLFWSCDEKRETITSCDKGMIVGKQRQKMLNGLTK